MTRLLVCGGRNFKDIVLLLRTLEPLRNEIEILIHGAARGADNLAAEWANRRKIPTLPFPADWGRHGKSAGPRRNQKMLDEGKPTLVIAFPGGRGTADMVKRSRSANIEVREVF